MRLPVFLTLPFMIIPIASARATDFPQASAVLEQAIADEAFPGCAVAVGNRDGILWGAGFGHHDYEIKKPVTPETIYDLASLTKVVGTTAVLMRLVALDKLDVSQPVATYLPEFSGDPSGPEYRTRQTITVADLLRHEGGLASWKPFYRTVHSYSELLEAALAVPLESVPGERYRYTDIGFILLGEVAARAGGKTLPELERELVFNPLRMKLTGRNPPGSLRDRIPPTERWADREGFVHGVVHDENARAGDGITGHAGLFAAAPDLALLARELLRGWEGESRLFPSEVMEQFSGRRAADRHRALGWALSSGSGSGGSLLSPSAFGHTGFTGTSIWIDPEQNLYIILLTNRVHPTRDNQKIGRVRANLADAAVRDLRRHAQINTGIRTGAERLAAEDFERFRGLRIGLIANHTAIARGRHLADAIHESGTVKLTALLAAEHGFRGDAPAGIKVEDTVDERTGVPVFSLYGATRKPTPPMLEEVDVLLFDMFAVGARFYTRLSTMGYAMQAAAEKGIPFVVLDRPNPLGGELVEGFVLEPGFKSFVGLYPLPVVYGMTVGELARMIQGEALLDGLEKLDLSVIEVEGWTRDRIWPDLGRDWTPPSPNIPDFETALIYPGACFFEGTVASEGRGTREPFRLLGAPWIDAEALADDLNGRALPGLEFQPVSFTPVRIEGMDTDPKHRDTEIHGVRITISAPREVRPAAVGVHLLEAFLRQASDKEAFFHVPGVNRLAGTNRLHRMLLDGVPADEIVESWTREARDFRDRRQRYLLYPAQAGPDH